MRALKFNPNWCFLQYDKHGSHGLASALVITHLTCFLRLMPSCPLTLFGYSWLHYEYSQKCMIFFTSAGIAPCPYIINVIIFFFLQSVFSIREHIQYHLEVLKPWAEGKPCLWPGQWPRLHRCEKDFSMRQNWGAVYHSKLAAHEKTRQCAAVKNNTFYLIQSSCIKIFNIFIHDDWNSESLTFKTVKILGKHNVRNQVN